MIFKVLQQLANPPSTAPEQKKTDKSSGPSLWLAAIVGIGLGLLIPELPSQASLRDLSIATLALLGAYVLIKRR